MKSTESRIFEAAMRIFAERGATHISVSELSEAAGVARGTIYNNLDTSRGLLEEVAARLAAEMHGSVVRSFVGIEDPALRLSIGVRQFVRRAHEEPSWGRFIVRFALSDSALQGMIMGAPGADLAKGIETGRYKIDPFMQASILALIGGSALSAILLVLDGHKTWRDAGSEVVELLLRALGLSQREAHKLARVELPLIPKLI